MTSPAEPASTDARQASQLTKPLRELAALVLLGANAVFLFVGLIRLLAPREYSTFTGRAGSAFFAFVGVEAVALPLLAVLLATHVQPVLPKAKLITQVALGEYAASAVLGGLTFLIWTVGRLAEAEVLDAFLGLLTRLAWLAVFAVAAFAVHKIWRTLYHVPKPKPQPGVYGQPQPGWPQQPGGQPAPGQPGGWGGPVQYGAPYGEQPSPFQPGPQSAQPSPFQPGPQSAQPSPVQPGPQSAPPFNPTPQSGPPFGQPPSADPTQAIPRQPADPTQAIHRDPDADRTQRINPNDDPNHPH